MTSVIFFAIGVVRIAQVGALHHPQVASHHFLREANAIVGASECEGRKQQWINAPMRRLKGPVIHIHIPGPYHIVGNFLGDFARTHNLMPRRAHLSWDDLSPEADVWNDGTWTDLEDTFEHHTLDDLGCGTFKTILSIAVRHPLNMIMHRYSICQEVGMDVCPYAIDAGNCVPGSEPCPYDNNMVRVLAGKLYDYVDQPEEMTQADLELAKFRARQMDLIFIVEHLNETLQLGRTRLGWNDTSLEFEEHIAEEEANQKILESIDFQDWQALKERNRLDIELYEYMRELSLGMLRADGLPEPQKELDEVTPQWLNKTSAVTPDDAEEASTPPERRIAEDGAAYTMQEFRNKYGDAWLYYWDAARHQQPEQQNQQEYVLSAAES